MEGQASKSPIGPADPNWLCGRGSARARERIWMESVLRVHVPSLLVHCDASHLCQGAWRLCPRLTYAWIHIYWPTLRWLKTWLLISRQLYQDSNGQTIRLTGREQKDEGETARRRRHGKDGVAWMILIVMAISAVFLQNCEAKISSPPPPPALHHLPSSPPSHPFLSTLSQSHICSQTVIPKPRQKKIISKRNFSIKTSVIAQKLRGLHSLTPTTTELRVGRLLFPVTVFKCI